jgi:membrane fusion protein, multidrug efflux system
LPDLLVRKSVRVWFATLCGRISFSRSEISEGDKLSKAVNRTLIIFVAAAILGLLAYPKLKSRPIAGAPGGAPNAGGTPPSGGALPAGMPALPVTAMILRPQKLDNRISSTGTVMANEEVEIRSEMEGKIRHIAFKEGGKVSKGDLLVKIDDKELQANVLKAQSQRKLAEDNEYRMRMQLKIEAVSQKDYDQALNELNLAKAGEQLLRAQLEKTELRAPFSGVVGLKYVSEGALLGASTRITTLQEINPIKVDFSIPGKYAGWVTAGTPITFTVQGSDRLQSGKVYAVDPKIDPDTRTLHLRALCPNADGTVLPGSFAAVEVPLQVVDSALLIPTEAMTADARGPKVFLYKGGQATPVMVQAGMRTDSVVQITHGLQAGDTVLTSGLMLIRPGAPISLTHVE